MSKSRALLSLLAALVALSPAIPAAAQMDFSLDEAETEPVDSAEPAEPAEGEGEAEGDILSQLSREEGTTEETTTTPERRTESVEEIYAVQQIYALRINRLELAPLASFTVNDPYLRHQGVGLAANYWITNVLALGASFLWYKFSDVTDTELNLSVQRFARLGIPITEWQMGAHVNFTYVPFYGKFSAFNKLIFQWDAYLVGGVGFMRTRPIPVVDPAVREFDNYGFRTAFNLGLGLRVFLTRWLTIFVEFRNYLFLERFESIDIPLNNTDPTTWYASSPDLTNNAAMQVGFTMYFPFTFDYRLPK